MSCDLDCDQSACSMMMRWYQITQQVGEALIRVNDAESVLTKPCGVGEVCLGSLYWVVAHCGCEITGLWIHPCPIWPQCPNLLWRLNEDIMSCHGRLWEEERGELLLWRFNKDTYCLRSVLSWSHHLNKRPSPHYAMHPSPSLFAPPHVCKQIFAPRYIDFLQVSWLTRGITHIRMDVDVNWTSVKGLHTILCLSNFYIEVGM